VRYVYSEKPLDRVVLIFDRESLAVEGNSDDDSVAFIVAANSETASEGSVDASHLDHWESYLGKAFGWGWLTTNQQGYCDGLLVSFEEN
jgi:hypothetical protein